ncbi:cytochrome c oxidase subunit 4 [Pseudactinotalea sp. Z1739]|uniref:cytochrome c oxidase subunit 4 n=1 Tax=Pseudactinotalea sp. Z1739 TaxID=3413028 RepID=UPI003C7A1D76
MTDTHTGDAAGSTVNRPNTRRPMGVEMWSFIALAVFFLPVSVIYGLWSDWEPVGTTALALLMGMWGMVGFFLVLQGRKIDARPEDNPSATIEDNPAGDYGHFAPYSWWPFVLGIAVSLVFLGLAAGWWVFGLGVAVAVVGLIGHVFEFSRGPHAH